MKTNYGLKTTMIILILSMVACGASKFVDENKNPNINNSFPSPRVLTKSASCDEIDIDIKKNVITEMEKVLDSYYQCNTYIIDDFSGISSPVVSNEASGDHENQIEFTNTNIQEQGVDEADIVKTDGEYIYIATDTGVDIFKAWPLSDFNKVTTLALDAKPNNLYLVDDQLISISTFYNENIQDSFTRVIFIDVNNPENPKILRTKEIQGVASASRFIKDILHVIVSAPVNLSRFVDYPDYNPTLYQEACWNNSDKARTELDQIIKEYKEKNREKILAMTSLDFMPLHGDGVDLKAISCDSVFLDDAKGGMNFTGIMSLDLNDETQEQITIVKGRANTIYASSNNIYLAGKDSIEDATFIHQFAIGQGGALNSYTGSGAVLGHVLNSFSMSEYENTFRVATTVGSVWDGNSELFNNVYVLDATDKELSIIGSIQEIAKTEQIYSARFIGNRGYLVTFKKVDPFFVINLSDPKNPVIEGELKMPGFSSYLHLLDEDHVIGLGKDAEDAGTFAWFQGLKLAVFDVSDGVKPSITDELIIGSRGTSSYALNDSHAFTFEKTSGTLALPVAYYSDSSGVNTWGSLEYYGVHLYSVSADTGIEIINEVQLPSNSSQPKRTVIIGGDDEKGLYVFDDNNLYLYDMNSDYELLKTKELSNNNFYNECCYM